MAQADLLIADRCGMSREDVEQLDDEKWERCLAVARWLEEREVERLEVAFLRAFATIFRR